jgi:seryl-tRNA synthetase
MLDINYIRENRELVKKGMLNKGEKDTSAVDSVLLKDEEWRALVTELDQLRAESNIKARRIGVLMGEGKKEEAQALIRETGDGKERIKELEDKISLVSSARDDLLFRIPNVPDESVPVGKPMKTMWCMQHGGIPFQPAGGCLTGNWLQKKSGLISNGVQKLPVQDFLFMWGIWPGFSVH